VPPIVTPAEAGVQNIRKELDSGFRRNDDHGTKRIFYEPIKNEAVRKVATNF
jgi:hypothetical protein